MKKVISFLIIIFLFAGCSHVPPKQASLIKEVNEDQINKMNCVFLGKVEGKFKFWQVFIPIPFTVKTADATKDSAIEKAREMGATHIVWREKSGWEYKSALAEGHAYKCE